MLDWTKKVWAILMLPQFNLICMTFFVNEYLFPQKNYQEEDFKKYDNEHR